MCCIFPCVLTLTCCWTTDCARPWGTTCFTPEPCSCCCCSCICFSWSAVKFLVCTLLPVWRPLEVSFCFTTCCCNCNCFSACSCCGVIWIVCWVFPPCNPSFCNNSGCFMINTFWTPACACCCCTWETVFCWAVVATWTTGAIPVFPCWTTELTCRTIPPWFDTCATGVLLSWLGTNVTPWRTLVPCSFDTCSCCVKLTCCCPRESTCCFCWLFNTCCSWIFAGDKETSVLWFRLEGLAEALTLTCNVCRVCCPCGWIFCTKICFWTDWDCCGICWNICWGCTSFWVGFCCDTCWRSCLMTSSWTTMFCGWAAWTVCVVNCWFGFKAAWSCAGLSTFCCNVCTTGGCCCWLESFCWTNCWICLIWFAGNACDCVSWVDVCCVVWVLGFWPLIKLSNCCAWISCVWFCCWAFPGDTWFITVCTWGVIWFETCCRSILCCVPTIWGGDDIPVWGNILGCLGAIRLTGVVERIGCNTPWGDLLECAFTGATLVFMFVFESVPFNTTRCPEEDILCCATTGCFCITIGNPEFIICIPRVPVVPTVELVTAEEILGVLGWIGMGFFPWNTEAVVATGFGEDEIPSALPVLFPKLPGLSIPAFRKLTPLDTGTEDGTTPTVKGVLGLELFLDMLLLLTTEFTNVLCGNEEELGKDVPDTCEAILAFTGNLLLIPPSLVELAFNFEVSKWFTFSGVDTEIESPEFLEERPWSCK